MLSQEFHEAADIFPPMTKAESEALVTSIREHGQLVPVWKQDGKILDGRARVYACAEAGVEPEYREWEGSPLDLILSLNGVRRQLTKSQLACAAVKALPHFEAEAKRRQGSRTDLCADHLPTDPSGGSYKNESAHRAGDAVGVSGTLVRKAKKIRDWNPSAFDEVWRGQISLNEADRRRKRAQKPKGKPNPRNLPLDVIFTISGAGGPCCAAVDAGLKYGINSSSISGLCPCTDRVKKHAVAFVDNDYFNYNHEKHLQVLRDLCAKGLKPKYATVRDIMTVEQCAETVNPKTGRPGIEYFSLERILEMAAEVDEYAEHTILIPKYDCLDEIPERYILGYSIESEHGGTPLPVEMFRERRVHLLGGSWKDQLAHMAILGDDVVSLDNNHVNNIARFAQFVAPDGDVKALRDIGLGYLPNPRMASLVLSFGAMGAKVNELYPAKPEVTEPAEAA